MSQLDTAFVTAPTTEPQRTWAEWLAWVATEDHCEWANRYVMWIKTPLGILAMGAVCSLLCGLFVAQQGYILLAAIAAVISVGLVWPLVAIRGVRCRLVFETRRGREGKPSTGKLVVTNRWPWPVWGLSVSDPLPTDGADTPLALARVEGWSTATFRCSFTPSQRGVYPNREVRVATGFPFGLYQASRPTVVPRRVVVWPQTFCLPSLGTAASRPHWRGVATDRRAGSDGTRLGVREHRIGDSLRDVHWAKTARYERLIVNERESTIVEDVTVIVDVDPGNHAGVGGDSTLEWSLRFAASICESVVANQGRVDLWLGADRLTAGNAPGEIERLLDGLAGFEPSDAIGAPPTASRNAAGLVVNVGTDATVMAPGRAVVFRRSGFGARLEAVSGERDVWIRVESSEDVPGQVLRGWRLGARRTRRAV